MERAMWLICRRLRRICHYKCLRCPHAHMKRCLQMVPDQHSLKQDKDKSTCTLHIFTQGLRMIPPNRVEAAVPKSWASYGGMAA